MTNQYSPHHKFLKPTLGPAIKEYKYIFSTGHTKQFFVMKNIQLLATKEICMILDN